MNYKANIAGLMIALLPSVASPSPVTGTFIQLNRSRAQRTPSEWQDKMEQMRAIGIRSVIVQWTAQPRIAYIDHDDLPAGERYPAVQRILDAAQATDLDVHLGLFHDPDYWTAITARPRVLRDYFLVKTARHEAVQQALLDRFADHTAWAGYYIPDEIDDLSWRNDSSTAQLRAYLTRLRRVLALNDPRRPVSVSAFFRSRTAPTVFRDNLNAITRNTGLDRVLVQDGTGTGDPAAAYLPVYYATLTKQWPTNAPALACVIEAFTQTSSDESFTAEPAAPERVQEQLVHAIGAFDELVLFTFGDYVDPDLGPASRALYDLLLAAP